MAHRHVPGTSRRRGETQAHQVGPHGVRVGGLGIEGKAPGSGKLSDQIIELFSVVHRPVFHIHSRPYRLHGWTVPGMPYAFPRFRNPGDDPEELQLPEKVHYVLPVISPEAAVLQVQHHRRVPYNCGQLLPLERPFSIIHQGLLKLWGLHIVQVFIEGFQASCLQDELDRRLVPHTRDTGYVVRWVAFEGLQVGLLGGNQARVTSPYLFFVVYLPVLDVVVKSHPDPWGNQLESVRIPGEDDGLDFLLLRLPAKGTDNVVGLEALRLENGHLECPHHLPYAIELRV